MTNALLDSMTSLTSIMQEETEKLALPGRVHELGELANAKNRLVGRIESELARLKREHAGWPRTLDEETRAQLEQASQALTEASVANARILERHIELSVDMMNAIAAEAQRITGKRNTTYGKSGAVWQQDLAAPIALNTRL